MHNLYFIFEEPEGHFLVRHTTSAMERCRIIAHTTKTLVPPSEIYTPTSPAPKWPVSAAQLFPEEPTTLTKLSYLPFGVLDGGASWEVCSSADQLLGFRRNLSHGWREFKLAHSMQGLPQFKSVLENPFIGT